MYEKAVVYDPETRDWAMYLDGELVGFELTEQRAHQTLDELIGELIGGVRPDKDSDDTAA